MNFPLLMIDGSKADSIEISDKLVKLRVKHKLIKFVIMYKDQITIIINTFNSEEIIHKCIQSIKKDISILIIENSKNNVFKKNLEIKYSNVNCTLAG